MPPPPTMPAAPRRSNPTDPGRSPENSDARLGADSDPFDVVNSLPQGAGRTLYSLLRPPLERLLALDALRDSYQRFQDRPPGANFFEEALLHLGVELDYDPEALDLVPREGAVLVIANHPFGCLDGLALGALLLRVRPDMKLLANGLLGRMHEIRPSLIAVNPFGGSKARQENLAGMKAAIAWLHEGNLLATFPAGEVAHLDWRHRSIVDPPWSENTVRLARRTGATIVPLYFHGRNSLLFQTVGMVHPILRTAMLPRELLRARRPRKIEIAVGPRIPHRRLERFQSARAATDYLRLNTCILRNRPGFARASRQMLLSRHRNRRRAGPRTEQPLAPAVATESLRREVAALPPEALLVNNGRFKVFIASAGAIPRLMEEIGRLRELTFREVHEGTGKASDRDCFDAYYWQLFLWDEEVGAVAGAYRIGETDTILKEHGLGGLYSHTLFRFRPAFLKELNPALELGRSFVTPQYQRRHSSLGLLWRGIGRFVVRNPRYRMLFGPVSITAEYESFSRDLIVQFLRENRMDRALARYVRPRKPPRPRQYRREFGPVSESHVVDSIDEVSALISAIEVDQKGVPILLRHYVKLNARLLAFNVDPDFNHSLDGLMVVDLFDVDPRLLRNYLGEEGVAAFHAAQGARR